MIGRPRNIRDKTKNQVVKGQSEMMKLKQLTKTRKLSYCKDGRAMRPMYMGALKIFGSPWLCPRLLFSKLLMGFCCDQSYVPVCAYKIWSS